MLLTTDIANEKPWMGPLIPLAFAEFNMAVQLVVQGNMVLFRNPHVKSAELTDRDEILRGLSFDLKNPEIKKLLGSVNPSWQKQLAEGKVT
jgi:hypothetical protein